MVTAYRQASESDLPSLIKFLKTPAVDNSFHLPLSQRDITIEERVYDRHRKGVWVLAIENNQILAACAIYPTDPGSREVTLSTSVIHPVKRQYVKAFDMGMYTIRQAITQFNAVSMVTDFWSGDTDIASMLKFVGFVFKEEFVDPIKRSPGEKTTVYTCDLTGFKF